MYGNKDILAHFSSEGGAHLLYLPDLTLWYTWHRDNDTLPEVWQGYSLPQIARAMDVPVWLAVQPWRVQMQGVDVSTTETDDEQLVHYETAEGALTARWTLGPDGDWWQVEYPVKGADDLAAAVAVAQARSYVLETSGLQRSAEEVGDDGVLALELPKSPYSALLHDFLGWSQGLTVLGEPLVEELLVSLERNLRPLVEGIAPLAGDVVLAPDNLDGQFISPRAFERHMRDSYTRTADIAHRHGKPFVVHVGGPAKRLLAPLVAAGVDVVEGVAGPPQGDASLSQAREIAGPSLTLWGGIAQDALIDAHDWAAFEQAVTAAAKEARGDDRMVLGVADRVPVDAEIERLKALPGLLAT